MKITMKEKTFEELIEEKLTATKEGYVVYTDDIKELLQQVREATIAEVLKLADDNFFNKEPKGKLMADIEEMKTDRIKTEK